MSKSKSVKKGGCGCQKSHDDLILKGGASFDVNNPSVIPFNNYNGDPSDPSQIMSVRMQPNMNSSFLSGGKKKDIKEIEEIKEIEKVQDGKKIKKTHNSSYEKRWCRSSFIFTKRKYNFVI